MAAIVCPRDLSCTQPIPFASVNRVLRMSSALPPDVSATLTDYIFDRADGRQPQQHHPKITLSLQWVCSLLSIFSPCNIGTGT